jgi:hypothetical protein
MNRVFIAATFSLIISSIILAGLSSGVSAATCDQRIHADSGVKTVSIAELYTSEGCDSCPPADKWFSTISLKKNGVVPLAFHVDYWDYIGWKDRFGKPSFAERQRKLVGLQGSRTVYTPQVMLDGKDAHNAVNYVSNLGSSNFQLDANIRDLAAKPAEVSLKLRAQSALNAIDVAVTVGLSDELSRKDGASSLSLYFVLTENNLYSRVTAGENKGALLKHDHVVRELSGPIQIPADAGSPTDSANNAAAIKRTISLPKDWKREDLNLVAFVQNNRSGRVLQAVSVPFCAP